MRIIFILILLVFFPLYGESYFEYVVESRDTILSISNKFKVDNQLILEQNGLKDNQQLYINQVLKVPVSYTKSSPITSNLANILNKPTNSWRNPSFEIYSWDKSPRVLIFDTINYSFQSLMFKRLAFFIEKKDYIGKIYSLDEIESERGWNGHDYQANDLALFFNKAKKEGYKLTRGEEILLEILLDNQILGRSVLGYVGRGGAVISCSRSSYYNHRKTILRHEAFHGLFFTSAAFRSFVSEVWKEQDLIAKELWILYLGFLGYEATDHELVINEFMAYMLQLNEQDTYDYFYDVVYDRLYVNFPEHREKIVNFFEYDKTPYGEAVVSLNSFIQKLNIE